jgi:peroxiredoxin
MNHAFFVTERQPAAIDGYAARSVAKAIAEVGVKDTAAVDVRNWHSMQYWAKWLGISEQQLIRATRVAGTNVALIEAHLAERRAKRQRKRMAQPA